MKYIEIDKSKIKKLYSDGVESNIYLYDLDGQTVLLKLLKDKSYDFFYLKDELLKLFTTDNEEKLESKRKKIEIMSENKAINDEIGNIGNAIFDGKIVGYFMPFDMEYVRPISEYDKRKDKIVVLKRLKEKVEKLN